MEYKKDANGNIIKVERKKGRTVKVVNPTKTVRKQPKNINVQPTVIEKKDAPHKIDPSTERRNPLLKYQKVGKIEPIFKDKVIYLIGGGPSLKNFDFKLLKNKVTIAINKAFMFLPDADVLYWTDFRFYKWYEKEINDFKGLKVTNKNKPIRDDVLNLKDTGRSGLDLDKSSLRHGNNSGFATINLAVHLGAKKIVLLGYDMQSAAMSTHWHDGYKKINHNHKIYQKSMIPYFHTLVEPLKKLGVQVWNANPKSNLDVFPKCNLIEAINMK